VFLSSHSLSEVQRVADRVGIIRRGKLVAVEIVSELRSKAIRRIEFDFSTPVEGTVFEAVPGVREVSVEDHRVVLSYDGKIELLLRVVMDRYDLLDIHTQEADLEEIFLTYYRDEEITL
jgi:ABC-2 type transport system ATP-binding protein